MKTLRIKKTQVIMTLVYVIMLKPAYFSNFAVVSTAWNYLQFVMAVYSFYLILKNKTSIPLKIVFALYLVFIFSSIINGKFSVGSLSQFIPYFVLPIFCEVWIKRFGTQAVSALYRVLLVYVVLNFISILIFPNGLYTALSVGGYQANCWFLGYKNPQVRTILPTLSLALVCNYRNGRLIKKYELYFLFLISLISMLLVESLTGVAAVGAFILLIIWLKNEKKIFLRIFNPVVTVVGITLLSFGFTVFSIQNSLLIQFQHLLGSKDIATLSNRTYVWENALLAIKDHLLIGCGSTRFVSALGFNVTHPHNYFLFVLMAGGIIGFSLLLCYYYIVFRQLYLERKIFNSRVFIALMIVILFMGIVESLTEFPALYAVFNIGYLFSKAELTKEESR